MCYHKITSAINTHWHFQDELAKKKDCVPETPVRLYRDLNSGSGGERRAQRVMNRSANAATAGYSIFFAEPKKAIA